MSVVSKTYGELPTYPEFKNIYDEAMKADGSALYKIRSTGGHIAEFSGNYNAQELFALLVKLKVKWENGDEGAGNLASDILFSLGVEWV
jgi:hypothetical protein